MHRENVCLLRLLMGGSVVGCLLLSKVPIIWSHYVKFEILFPFQRRPVLMGSRVAQKYAVKLFYRKIIMEKKYVIVFLAHISISLFLQFSGKHRKNTCTIKKRFIYLDLSRGVSFLSKTSFF